MDRAARGEGGAGAEQVDVQRTEIKGRIMAEREIRITCPEEQKPKILVHTFICRWNLT